MPKRKRRHSAKSRKRRRMGRRRVLRLRRTPRYKPCVGRKKARCSHLLNLTSYFTTQYAATGAGFTIHCGNMSNPLSLTGDNEPYGFAQMIDEFKYYHVVSVKAVVTLHNTSAQPMDFMMYALPDGQAEMTPEEALERKGVARTVVNPGTTNNVKRLTYNISLPRLYGLSLKEYLGTARFQSTTSSGASMTTPLYVRWRPWADISSQSVYFSVYVKYKVLWTGETPVGQS